MSSTHVSHPEAVIENASKPLQKGESANLCFSFDFEQYYLPEKPTIKLLAVVELKDGLVARFSLQAYSLKAEQKLLEAVASCAPGCGFNEAVKTALQSLQWPLLDGRMPLRLEPVHIEKPWGQEIWFTGIESRGQSRVTDGAFSVPLPWVLALLPEHLAATEHQRLNLLKILDPLPEEVFGDLYFELHEEKQEVYVVTHVDSQAWPSRCGKIKIGFDQDRRHNYASDEDFVAAYREAVKEYEGVRRMIDAILDDCRRHEGIALDEPVSAATTKKWLKSVDGSLIQQEQMLRSKMDSFKGEVDLRVGDVLKVPCYTPHSLMHGVRTIEFQTPVYERKILSFAQKVLTQNQWDTEAAISCMSLEAHQLQPLKPVQSVEGINVEEVVEFSDFKVWRLTFTQAATFELSKQNHYALVIGVSGAVCVNEQWFSQEGAGMIPAASDKLTISARESSVALIAFPKVDG